PPSPHRYSTTLPPPPSPTPFPTRRSSDLPDPGNIGVVPPTNKYLLGDDLQMARNTRVSVGIDHAFTPRVRLGMNYAHVNGSRVLRGLNLNAPVNGVRPSPLFGNIVEVVDDAASRQHTVSVFWQVNIL